MVVFAAVIGWADGNPSVQPAAVDTLRPVATAAAAATAASLVVLGIHVIREGTVIYQGGDAGMQIDVGCLGIPMLALLGVAMSAYAAPLRCKLAGIVTGLGLLCGLNVLRFVHLFWLRVYHPAAFTFSHDILWRVILTSGFLAIWLVWRSWSDVTTRRQRGDSLAALSR
jgi:exosortase/archaeosortase family protein